LFPRTLLSGGVLTFLFKAPLGIPIHESWTNGALIDAAVIDVALIYDFVHSFSI